MRRRPLTNRHEQRRGNGSWWSCSMALSHTTSTMSLLFLHASPFSDIVLCISPMAGASLSPLAVLDASAWTCARGHLGRCGGPDRHEDASNFGKRRIGASALPWLLLPDTERLREPGLDRTLFLNVVRRFLTPALFCLASAIMARANLRAPPDLAAVESLVDPLRSRVRCRFSSSQDKTHPATITAVSCATVGELCRSKGRTDAVFAAREPKGSGRSL